MFGHRFGGLVLCVTFAALCVAGLAADNNTAPPNKITPEDATFFENQVRPLLANRCYACHSDKIQSGGLRLDSLQALLKGNSAGPALVPGHPDKSLLLHVLSYEGKIKMPPTGKLNSGEIATLTDWIKRGAPWPGAMVSADALKAGKTGVVSAAQRRFWSFRGVERPLVPKVKNAAWVKTPLDAFILSKLEGKGLAPSPLVDKRSLLRRVTFDLTGLPPTPEEMASFLSDKSSGAYGKVVERLLSSSRYGERWGRHWLDVARYADSNGLDENLAFGNAYRYRDYVIAALNQDKPYNQFLMEQLAGDLMPTDDETLRNERLTATAFLALGPKVLAEQDKQKLVMDIVDEQIEVSSKAFMGLTVACARCHDHKFDPIPTKDYYALAGIFKSTRAMKDLSFVSRVMERPLMTKELEAQVQAHTKKVQELEAAAKTLREQGNTELVASFRRDANKYLVAGWEVAQQPELKSVADAAPVPNGPFRLFVEAEKFDRGNVHRDFETYGKGIGVIHNVTTPDNAEWDVMVPAAGVYQVELRYAAAESRPVRLLLDGKVLRESTAGQVTGSWQPDGQRWEVQGLFAFRAGKNTLRIERDSYIPHFDKLLIAAVPNLPNAKPPRPVEEIAAQYGLNPVVIRNCATYLRSRKQDAEFETWKQAVVPLVGAGPDALANAPQEFARRALQDQKGPFVVPEKPEEYYPNATREAVTKANDAVKKAQEQAPAIPQTLAVEEDKPGNLRVHLRGSHLTLGEEAPRRFLTVLGGDKSPPMDDKRSGRLELAQWLARPDHPLTGRVLVNRVWQVYFGHGLVRTPDNFGLRGERPTHPELLDWLAATFTEGMRHEARGMREKTNPYACDWSLKKLHRLIVMSNTYQQSTANNPKAEKRDPDNRLLWRMPRRRLEAEPFRDAILAVSGQLDTTMGGTLLTTGNNDYVTNDQSGNAARYENNRRSIYLPIIRNALYDMFQAFDVGDPSMVNAFRPTTTVAPQALFIMNSPFVLEKAKHFASTLLESSATSDAERVRQGYLRAFGRPPTAAETSRALRYVTQFAAHLSETELDAAKRRLRAWQSWCQILFASNEFIYLN